MISMFDRRVTLRSTRNSIVANNRILVGDTFIVLPPALRVYSDTSEAGLPGDLGLSVERRVISDVNERAMINVDILERLLAGGRNSEQRGSTIRLAGLFTSFSSSRDTSGASDYDALMLRERELVSELIRCRYDVRILASLDIPMVLSSWGYDESRLQHRLFDLMEQLRRFSENYPNLQFTVDTHNRLAGQFIIGNSLLIHSLMTTAGVGYSMTAYETNPVEIENAIRTFDDAFEASLSLAHGIRKTMKLESVAGYTEALLRSRLEHAGVALDFTD
ncbi:hypothetical protein [Streptomyces chartreusis]|uniref:Uncharacterized protein n=1 Tax=Streptomyces chartreusis TaxID=1969 RepID=A0A7H8T1M4_STRCX|nr:hypothetical protein [Streptomyces chartreusis]QKZ17331.1 hypothetical protein HUT05_08195 [Streptomyces chartreusis]